jgi:hypothetical protein
MNFDFEEIGLLFKPSSSNFSRHVIFVPSPLVLQPVDRGAVRELVSEKEMTQDDSQNF